MKEKSKTKSYEAVMAELESIVTQMERGELSLEESFAKYQQGLQLADQCQQILTTIEKQVKVFEAGRLTDWEEESLSVKGDQ